MRTKRKILSIQTVIIIFLWLLLLIMPLLFENNFSDNGFTIPKIWIEYSWVFVLFLINRFVLMPYLFFRNKHLIYFILIVTLVLILFFGMYLNWGQKQPKPSYNSVQMSYNTHVKPPRRDMPMPPFVNIFILSFLIIGFDTGLNISMRWMLSERKRVILESENINVKLALLRNQISPHFFMNTLNNIHALVDIDQELSKDSIIRLSKLMSYLLYETNETKILLKNELDFISNYVDLMRLRYSDKVRIKFDMSVDVLNVKIPPLLFLNFIENAFKHGISYKHDSFIEITFNYLNNTIICDIINSNHAVASDKLSGIGILNARNILELLYNNKYKLDIVETSSQYHVSINIPV